MNRLVEVTKEQNSVCLLAAKTGASMQRLQVLHVSVRRNGHSTRGYSENRSRPWTRDVWVTRGNEDGNGSGVKAMMGFVGERTGSRPEREILAERSLPCWYKATRSGPHRHQHLRSQGYRRAQLGSSRGQEHPVCLPRTGKECHYWKVEIAGDAGWTE